MHAKALWKHFAKVQTVLAFLDVRTYCSQFSFSSQKHLWLAEIFITFFAAAIPN